MCRDFWQSFFHDEDPLDDIATDEVEELDVGLLPLDITADDVKEAFHLLKKKAPGRDDIRLTWADVTQKGKTDIAAQYTKGSF